ncbi:MAG: hypothetical protein NPIRA02_24420 [Nitrospirales bacterium]|nr:MAG: hypothetical protein NPIRA02_24420 [Nitrospirales bacterium]
MLCLTIAIVSPNPAISGGFQSPEECLAYDDNAHLNCLYAYIEIQQDTIEKLETRLKTAQHHEQQLNARITRQRSVNDQLEQRIRDHTRALRAYRFPRIRGYSGFSYGVGPSRYYRRLFHPSLGFHIGHNALYW